MAYFPFFIDIENKKGLIVGGGRIAAHKAEKVKPFGAKITIIAPDIMDKLKQDPAFMCEERPFVPEDIEGCAFVIAATDDRELNHRISALCQEKGILVNVVDDKDYCGFLFPSLVKEGKLTAGISTAGASPQIAAELRSRMARELPNQMEEILDYLESIREPAKKMIAEKNAELLCFMVILAFYGMTESSILDVFVSVPLISLMSYTPLSRTLP